MSAADRLRALERETKQAGYIDDTFATLQKCVDALPALIAVVEAAEQVDDPVCDVVSGQARPEFCLPYLIALRDALAALNDALARQGEQ